MATSDCFSQQQEKPYACKVCQRRFHWAGSLSRHAAIHSELNTFKCKVCSSSFAQRSDLDTHMQIHEAGNSFQCTICQEAFRDNILLAQHLQEHFGKKVISDYSPSPKTSRKRKMVSGEGTDCSLEDRTFSDSFEMGMDGPAPKSALTTFDFSSVPTLSTISGGDLPSPARRSLQMLNVFGTEHDLSYKQGLFGGNKEPDMFKVSMDAGDPLEQCLNPSLEMTSSYLPSLSALSGISNTQFTTPLVPAGASRGLDADDSMPQPLSPALSPVSKLHRNEGEVLLSSSSSYSCSVCRARFVWMSSLKRHERIHVAESDAFREKEKDLGSRSHLDCGEGDVGDEEGREEGSDAWNVVANSLRSCHSQFLVDEEPIIQEGAKQRAG